MMLSKANNINHNFKICKNSNNLKHKNVTIDTN